MSFQPQNIIIIGATGGIGSAFLEEAQARYPMARVTGLSRSTGFDLTDEASISAAAEQAGKDIDLVIVATGLLHSDQFGPEKSLKDLNADTLAQVFAINTFGPALVMKHFLPRMAKDRRSVFAALSARVGSVSDNRIGGWYGYRAAKAALNQMIRTASIEHARRWREGIVVGLHPGTVDTGLSKPFQRHVAEGKLFTPAYSASAMLDVLEKLDGSQTSWVFDFAGEAVHP
ncbi:MAG: SDR family NAD(P)-dependent oxidoreductase [Pseudomonadota bacterium]